MDVSLITENQRFKILREHLGFSQESFATELGRRQGSISDIERGRNSIDGIVKLLEIKFNVNENWLRKGEGEMFTRGTLDYNLKNSYWTEMPAHSNQLAEPFKSYEKSVAKRAVPVYYNDISTGLHTNPDLTPVAWLNTPEFAGCDAVIQVKDDSMHGIMNERDWVGIRKINNWQAFLPMNYMYAIRTDDFELIRTIRKGPTEDTFNLVIDGNDHFETKIQKSLIKEVWTVKVVLPYSKIETFL